MCFIVAEFSWLIEITDCLFMLYIWQNIINLQNIKYDHLSLFCLKKISVLLYFKIHKSWSIKWEIDLQFVIFTKEITQITWFMLDFLFQTVFEHVTSILVVKHVLQEILMSWYIYHGILLEVARRPSTLVYSKSRWC